MGLFKKSPEKEREKWIKDFVNTTPLEYIYPVNGPNYGIISYGTDKVADSLGLNFNDAYKLLCTELSRRGLPHHAPPELQSKIDRRIESEVATWHLQVSEYLDSPEDALAQLDCKKEISKNFGVPSRIAGIFLLNELHTRTPEYKAEQERKARIQAELLLHESLVFNIVGVTFKNGRRSRQTILRQIYFRDPPYTHDPDIRIEKVDYEGQPAFAVFTNGEQVGFIGKDDIPAVLERWDKYEEVTEFSVFGGGPGKSYGMDIRVQFKR